MIVRITDDGQVLEARDQRPARACSLNRRFVPVVELLFGAPVLIAAESVFDDADDRLARSAMFGGERCGRFGERPYRSHDRLQPSVPEALGEVR